MHVTGAEKTLAAQPAQEVPVAAAVVSDGDDELFGTDFIIRDEACRKTDCQLRRMVRSRKKESGTRCQNAKSLWSAGPTRASGSRSLQRLDELVV